MMNDTTATLKPLMPLDRDPSRGRLKRWTKRLAILAAFCVVCGVGFYFYACSHAFFNSWVRPSVEKQLGRSISVDGYSLSPWGLIELDGVVIEALEGEELPPLKLDHLECRWRLMALASRRLEISRLAIDSLTIRVVQKADGSLHGPFPTIEATAKEEKTADEEEKKTSEKENKKPFEIDLRDLDIKNVNIIVSQFQEGAKEPNMIRIENMSVRSQAISLEGKSTVEVAADLSARLGAILSRENPPNLSKNFEARLALRADIEGKNGGLAAANATIDIEKLRGSIEEFDLGSYGLSVRPQLTAAPDGETQNVSATIEISSGGASLARTEFLGTWNLKTSSGRAETIVHPVDSRVLNIVGASQGIDFRDTVVSGKAAVTLAENATPQSLDAEFKVANLNPKGGPLPAEGFPSTDASLALRASATPDLKMLILETLAVDVDQKSGSDKMKIVAARLKKPLRFDMATYRPAPGSIGQDALTVSIRDLRPAQWQALLPADSGARIEEGVLTADLMFGEAAGSQKGDAFALTGTLRAAGFKGVSGKETFGPLTTGVEVSADLDAAQQMKVHKCLITLDTDGRDLGSVALSADMNLKTLEGQADVKVQDFDFSQIPFSGLAEVKKMVLQGKLQMRTNARLLASPQRAGAEGNLSFTSLELADASDPNAKIVTPPLFFVFKQEANIEKKSVRIDQFDVISGTSAKPFGTLKVTGDLDYASAIKGAFRAQTTDFQFDPFMPLLQAAAKSVDLNGATFSCDQNVTLLLAESKPSVTAKGQLSVAGLRPPKVAGKPLAAPMRVLVDQDAAFAAPLVTLNACGIKLEHAGKEPNTITVAGKMNIEKASTDVVLIKSDKIELKPLMPYGGVEPVADAPPLDATKLSLLVGHTDKGFEVKNLMISVAQGDITCDSFSIDPSVKPDPVLRWTNLKGLGVDVETLAANLAPKQRGYLSGKAGFETSGSAQGFSPEAREKFLRTTLEANVVDGEILNTPIFNEVANVTGVEELKRIVFIECKSKYRTDQAGIHIESFDVLGDTQRIGLSGLIGYDDSIDLPMKLGVKGALKAKVQKQKYAMLLQEDEAGYLMFPLPLGVGGTLAKPKVALTFPSGKELLDKGIDTGVKTGLDLLEKKLQEKMGTDDKKKDDTKDDKKKDPAKDALEGLKNDALKRLFN